MVEYDCFYEEKETPDFSTYSAGLRDLHERAQNSSLILPSARSVDEINLTSEFLPSVLMTPAT